jgi:tRNA-dihydrouridine synthase
LRDVLRSVKSAVTIPVTIKVRTGWDQDSRNTHEVTRIAADEGISWVAIHGRTRAQGYSGQADWDYIRDVAAASPLPVLGNGDIQSAATAVRRFRESGGAGVLIGRGCLKNPWIFREAMALLARDFNQVLISLSESLERCFEERMVALQLKKFSAWFSAGYPGSATFRRNIFAAKEKRDVVAISNEYYASVATLVQADTSGEAFLMGGHG